MVKNNLKEFQICLNIMEELNNNLLCKYIFNLLIFDNEQEKKLLNFLEIKNKLIEKNYSTINQWEKDINLLLNYLKKNYQNDNLKIICINECLKIFEKLLKKLIFFKLSKWCEIINYYELKLNNLNSNSPPILSAFFDSPEDINNFDEKPITEEEINIFVRVSQYLNTEEDYKAILLLINKYQPDLKFSLENEIQIDVSDLKSKTIRSLRNFFKKRLAQKNLLYPNLN